MELTQFDITVLFILAVLGLAAFIIGGQAFAAWLRFKWDRRQAIKRGEKVGDDMDFFVFLQQLEISDLDLDLDD